MSPAAERLFAWRGWVLAAFFAAVASARALSDAPLRPEALILVALGAGWRLGAGRHIAAHSNGARLEAGPLATGGPYALGRHPLYLANLVTAAGLLLYANSLPAWAMALLGGALLLHHTLLARAEEARLAEVHAGAYLRYMQVTPRWLGWPRRRGGAAGPAAAGSAGAEAPSGEAPVSWSDALRRQGGNLAKSLAMALLLWGLA